jgi:DNA-binding transcriptional regulator YiaG
MNEHRKRLPVSDQIHKGLEEAIRHARGEIALKTTVVEIPEPTPEIPPEVLTKLRTHEGLYLEVFARVLNVPTRTVRSWEAGTRNLTQAALRLIQVFRQNTAGVLEVVGMAGAAVPASAKTRTLRTRSKTRATPKVMS